MNSKQFIIERINNGSLEIDGLSSSDIDHATFLKPFSVWKFEGMDKILHDNIISFGLVCDDDNYENKLNVTIEYNPCGDFTYVTSDIRRHDGTLLFLAEALNYLRMKIMSAQTCDATMVPNKFTNVFDYDVKYVIGDFAVVNQFGDEFAPEDKPWMKQRQIVLLPIRCELIPKTE